MSYTEGHLARPGQPLLPSFSNRTLHQPSFLPLYMAAGFRLRHHHFQDHLHRRNQTIHPIIPAEFFYTDHTMSFRRRFIVTYLRVIDSFQVHTPPPVISACLALQNHPDPFRSRPRPTRDLNSPIWGTHAHHHRVQPNYVILQLTQEEDQAVTNLLKLHHQSLSQSSETFSSARTDVSSVVEPPQNVNSSLFYQRAADGTLDEEAYKPLCSHVQCVREGQQGEGWSDTELDVADTLLNGFILTEKDRIWGQNPHKSAGTLPDPRPYEHHGDSSLSTEALPAQVTSGLTHSDIGNISFSGAREDREQDCRDVRSTEDGLVSGEMRERILTDSERDALHVLLSLGNMGTLDMVQ
ncbi:hypothetical protein EXN66_Car013595 [Channa argus]|uniref:Uncharacterized protein n=1 Tax=Channa argus TaxID=215402 RepID=A0A6G1Q687_CHAAH|nr:hypothetical protein EXN66_Car013595 [Channa argus]